MPVFRVRSRVHAARLLRLLLPGAALLGLLLAVAAQPVPASSGSIHLGPIHLTAGGGCNALDPFWANRDDDGDGICNGVDVCPYEYNPNQDPAACAMQAITVPFDPSNLSVPHPTTSGGATTLKGIARYGGDQYRWEFGDGSPPMAWTPVMNADNLGVVHAYAGVAGQRFTATLSVRNSSTLAVATATYPLEIFQAGDLSDSSQTDIRAQITADQALWWLHRNLVRSQYPDGPPYYKQRYATAYQPRATCAGVDAFELHGSRPGSGHATDPYADDVQQQLNWVLANATTVALPATAPYGSSDVNGNGFGINLAGGAQLQATTICLKALADSQSPDRLAGTGGTGVYNRSYRAIVQDAVELVAYSQNTNGVSAGSWGYSAHDATFPGDPGDMVNEPLAMAAAESRMGATVPSSVRTLAPSFLDYLRHTGPDNLNGGYGYNSPNTWVVLNDTAMGIEGMAFLGASATSPQQQAAQGFVYRHWNGDASNTWGFNLGDTWSMYHLGQSLIHAFPGQTAVHAYDYTTGTQLPASFDWYYTPAGQAQQGYAANLITRQRADGSLADTAGYGMYDQFEITARSIVLLLRDGTASHALPLVPHLTWAPAPLSADQPLGSAQLNAGATDPGTGAAVPGSFTYSPAAGATFGVGTQTLHLTFIPTDVATYAPVDGTATLTVTRPVPSVTWAAPAAITYGAALGSTQLTATAGVPGSFVYTLDGAGTPASGAVPHAGAHSLTAVFTPTDAASYGPAQSTVPLTVTKAVLTVTAGNQARPYGAPNPALSASFAGFVNGDGPAAVTGSPLLTTVGAGAGVGSYSITVATGTLAAADYSFNFVPGSLSVTPAPLTVTADDKVMVYGGPVPTLTVHYSGFVNGDTAANLTTPPSLATTATSASHVIAGPFPITVAGSAGANYTITYAPGTLVIQPAPLTVTAEDQSRTYGAPNPTLSARYSGFVPGESATVLTGAPALATIATPASPVGRYAITADPGSLSSTDYTFSFLPGTLTVERAALTVTAQPAYRMYGAANPAFTVTYTGFANGESLATSGVTGSAACSSPAGPGSSVAGSPYPIICAPGSLAATNYSFALVPGALSVTPAPLTVTAPDATKRYGDPAPVLTPVYDGFVNHETAASLTAPALVSTTATAGSHVAGSPYLNTAAGAVDGNYSFYYVNGHTTVTPAPLSITADPVTKLYGAPVPRLTATYSGLVNGDTAATFAAAPNVAPRLATTATAGSHVVGSPYPITVTGAADTDYTITQVVGALTVLPVPLTVTADSKQILLGAPLPPLTVSYSGFVNGDTVGSLTTPARASTTATPFSPPAGNPYPITASGAVDPDYVFTYLSGRLTLSYRFLGFASPAPFATIGDRRLAVTFSLCAANNLAVTSASATLSVDGAPALPFGGFNTGNSFRFAARGEGNGDPGGAAASRCDSGRRQYGDESDAGHYLYLLDLSGLRPGVHVLTAAIDDGSTEQVTVVRSGRDREEGVEGRSHLLRRGPLTVVPNPVLQLGQAVTVSGGGFLPGTEVRINFGPHPDETVAAGPSGAIRATFSPSPFDPPGIYLVSATGTGATGVTLALTAEVAYATPPRHRDGHGALD